MAGWRSAHTMQVQILPHAITFWQAEVGRGGGSVFNHDLRVGLPLGQPRVTFEQSRGAGPKHN